MVACLLMQRGEGEETMGDLVNLNRFRKERDRAQKSAAAEENRARFGRKKGDKALDSAKTELEARRLDGHKRDEPET